ncbi:hypothetical protein Q73_11550 [Bacillus coahuilensis m2-6]|uniref:2-succinyl-5-enolpyruvyl-6-hydroxy-3-cyclohexene-1-carboxylate synthase n=1 Tax=Bacillus coahuilensis p1.1.43 TaxID=1150625 RepID=A0A147K6C6_9BACI|nr:2-succinyl-5-enolpyruvyl-6-hydroxy-3-cyclohexene-1-carboxylic-acid synthase [Bacillus coahuilensis]KUP05449.1 hypothetical protein Q75_12125 [Bacillus coahuilensis p1.1.43]KUP06353.1 hypothetical protein Q73_11550 [Bacillus coahuilensis m2-6]
MTEHQRDLTHYTAAFIDELAVCGIRHAVVSPGSRSTPLALTIAEHPLIHMTVHVDERSAGFFALGIAKRLREPVVLLCSSGTAGANYYPAVIEAKYSGIPLIVLTADRPHELREVGAAQAIDQIHLYGQHVKWSIDMPLPSESLSDYARRMAKRGVILTQEAPSGPVHYNFPFREPLIPDLTESASLFTNEVNRPVLSNKRIEQEDLHIYKEELREKQKLLIICGETQHPDSLSAIKDFGEKCYAPILADPLSGLRSQDKEFSTIIDRYDSFLRNPALRERFKPDLIIRFGTMPVSKALLTYLKEQACPIWIINDHGDWKDPIHTGTHYLSTSIKHFCSDVVENHSKGAEWLHQWKYVNSLTHNRIQSFYSEQKPRLTEGQAVHDLLERLPSYSTLFVGNSMPIRDIDTHLSQNSKVFTILANRGANGIDGVVSTALGVSSVSENTYLLIGDLSFLHDLGGLIAAKLNKLNLTVVVLNNNGGGIFSYLPQKADEKHFEALFGTPTDIEFSSVTALFGAQYIRVNSWGEWTLALEHISESKGLKIIEVMTNREENLVQHRNLWEIVSQEINMRMDELQHED